MRSVPSSWPYIPKKYTKQTSYDIKPPLLELNETGHTNYYKLQDIPTTKTLQDIPTTARRHETTLNCSLESTWCFCQLIQPGPERVGFQQDTDLYMSSAHVFLSP